MKFRFLIQPYVVIVALTISAASADAHELTVGDAYAKGSDESLLWAIGTKSIEMTFDARESMFRLTSYLNKSCEPLLEYVDVKTAAAPVPTTHSPLAHGLANATVSVSAQRFACTSVLSPP